MKQVMNEKGGIKWIVILAIIIIALFLAITFGRPFYKYNTLRSHTKDLLLSQVNKLPEIRQAVLADAEQIGVPLNAEDLQVTETKGEYHVIKVDAQWTERVDLFGYYQKDFDFDMHVEY